MINYTPINVDAYIQKNQANPTHKSGLNFFLLLVAFLTAIAFSVLLFTMIKNRSVEKIILPSQNFPQNINKEQPSMPEKSIPTQTLPTSFPVSPTLLPEENLTPQENSQLP